MIAMDRREARLSAPGRRRLIVMAVAGLVVVAAGLALWLWLLRDLPDVCSISQGFRTPSIRITDRQGRLLYEVIGEEAGRHTVVPLDEIPQACRDATIATEDVRFYTNPGIDARGIVRAVWINLRGGEVLSGGSTITQQVVRNLLLEPEERSERTLRRKLREAILAYRLGRRYSKDEILALYLNQTYYGSLAYGIDAAARAYFDRPVSRLDLAQCALLAGLPQAPTLYDPLTNPRAARERQATVLRLMVAAGFIDEDEAALARSEPLTFAAERYTIEAPHFVMTVYAQLVDLLPPEVLRAGGLEVHTTLDLDWQHTAERIARQQLALLNTPRDGQPPRNVHNAALVAMNPHTGEVLAMLGSPDYFDASISGAINMALSPRQPGSALKPFIYALALDPTRPEPWTAATMILDVRTTFATHSGFPYTPINYDRREHGPVLVREALASSYNIPAVVALDAVGVEELMRLLASLGITTLDRPSTYDLSLALGGGEVPLLELTAAYATLANQGKLVHPVLITEVIGADGEIIYRVQPRDGAPIIDPRVAWLIGDILSDNYARAPAFTTHSILQIGRPAAVKTGTTTDFRDNWTIGYTPDLVVGVWVGNASNERMVETSGVTGAGPIWHHFMRAVLRGQPERGFVRPEGLHQVEICTLSGLLPTPACPYSRLEWFILGTEPKAYDTFYRLVPDPVTGELTLYLDLPPAAHAWARSRGLPLLADAAAASPSAEGDALEILSPGAGAIYRIEAARPREVQRLLIQVVGPTGTHSVTISVDGRPVATVEAPPFEAWWVLTEGEHTVEARGILPDGSPVDAGRVTFRVNPPG
ncbi:MAG: PBP1A family penicillin-binding protein [Anaerolineae bacterium]